MTLAEPTGDDVLTTALQAVAGGDRGAFETVYELTASRVLGLCRRILIDPALSEEVSQEVFLEIWQTSSRFDQERGRALTWILTMAHRRAIDRVRASQSSRDRDLRIGIRDFHEEAPSVEGDVETSLEYARASAAMTELSAVQREAVELAYFGGLTQAEIAARTGVPIGTVKTRLRDALIRLRGLLGDSR
ncbi:ECF RNA polymerase sigma factor SigK [Frondihabitans australicus]|uniref:RNA polymerase sigma-70 factor (ECF subfamily) n=1 Tax=Frondihabitans australicus TaxID=386892 RepID=A0A495ID43_9MICO|nr:ECF RNA polymerase sigma factor SigK [Frondihabitans australicus]RKR73378.1 RNA polymerase sigma-70 factor (ECF subfamily) [Frondihabitans australicus]